MITWTIPSILNAPSINYNVELTDPTQTQAVFMGVTNTETTLNNLQPYTEYIVRVQACSIVGCGAFSQSSSEFTLEEGIIII